MELMFEKTVIPYLQTVARQMQSQEQTQQVRLPDAMPDIKKILACWGQVVVRGKQWQAGSVQITGGVMTWVLYASEEGQQPNRVEAWLPFQISVDIPDTDRDGYILARAVLRGVDARTLSDRKMLVRASVSVHMDVKVPDEAYVCQAGEVPQDIALLTNTYPMLLPVEMGEKHFSLEEPLDIGTQGQKLTWLRYNLETEITDSKIVSDKLVMRGTLSLDSLYLDEAGMIHSYRTEMPLSQYAQLETEHESATHCDICLSLTELEMEQTEAGGYLLKAGVLAQYVIYENKNVTLVEDAYSPVRTVSLNTEQLRLPAVLDRTEQRLQAETMPDLPGHQILDITAFTDDVRQTMEGARLAVNPTGLFQVLSTDPEGNLCSNQYRWECSWGAACSEITDAAVAVTLDGFPQCINQAVSVPLKLVLCSWSTMPISMIGSLEIGEAGEPDPNRPSLILRRMGTDTLWQLAKSAGSTVDAIKKANNITQAPDPQQILLIPIQ